MCHRQSRAGHPRAIREFALRTRFDTSNNDGDNAQVPAATVDVRVKGAPPRSTTYSRTATGTATAVYAAVALVPAVPGKDLLTYAVGDELRAHVAPGMRVVVPLGKRRETGIVVTLGADPPAGVTRIRTIDRLLDAEPILTPELFALCRWAADYYMTTLADVLASALPGGLRATSARVVRLVAGATTNGLGDGETAVVERLAGGAVAVRQLAQDLGRARVDRALERLVARGVVAIDDQLRAPAAKTKLVTVSAWAQALTADDVAVLARRAPRQHAVYARVAAAAESRIDSGALSVEERAAADALARRGVLGRLRALGGVRAAPEPRPRRHR